MCENAISSFVRSTSILVILVSYTLFSDARLRIYILQTMPLSCNYFFTDYANMLLPFLTDSFKI